MRWFFITLKTNLYKKLYFICKINMCIIISFLRWELFAKLLTAFHFVRSIPTIQYSITSFGWVNAFTGRWTSDLGATACTVCNKKNHSFFKTIQILFYSFLNIHLDTLFTSENVKFKHQTSTKFQFKILISFSYLRWFLPTFSPFFLRDTEFIK